MYQYFTPGEGNLPLKSEDELITEKKVLNNLNGVLEPTAEVAGYSYAEFEEGNLPLNSDGKKEVWRKICNSFYRYAQGT